MAVNAYAVNQKELKDFLENVEVFSKAEMIRKGREMDRYLILGLEVKINSFILPYYVKFLSGAIDRDRDRHAGDPGSNPGNTNTFFYFLIKLKFFY